MRLLKLGMDAELFLAGADGYETAIGRFGGTKQKPKRMDGLPRGFCVQEDNVAVEFNIPAAKTIDDFVQHTKTALSWLRCKTEELGFDLMFHDTATFTKKQLDHPQAQELGCEPDYNAWTRAVNPRPQAPEDFRTASAHLHLSWDDPTDDQRFTLVRMLDLVVGVPLVLKYGQTKRRTLYGRAGACRLKPYGVEYRVLGNQWISSEAEMLDVLYGAERASRLCPIENYVELLDEHEVLIQQAINTHDVALATRLVETFNIREL